MEGYLKTLANGESFMIPVDGVGNNIETISASATLTSDQSGKILLIGTDALTLTLPATTSGLEYCIYNSGADAAVGITVSPNASDKLLGSYTSGGVLVTMSGTDNKDIVNTKATAKKGDYIVIAADGADGWYIRSAAGIWTEESQSVLNSNPVTTADITEAVALTAADSGKYYSLNAAAGVAVTLPAVTAGLNYKFVVKAAFATTNFTIVATSNVIQGGAIVNSTFVPAANENTISFVATAETIGDYINIWSDGTNWYADGVGAGAGSITFTAP